MRWQDAVISTCQVMFLFAMIPSFRGSKPATATSVMNVVLVIAIALSQATLGLWFSAGTSSLVAGSWAILAGQKMALDKAGHDAATR